MWFDYDGTYNALVAPYSFDYNYPTIAYPQPYQSLSNYGSQYNQNPDYAAENIDAWGSYQENGATRFNNYQPWVNQTPSATFDPAAYQLKVIKLPSGGEIHVQYEQKDYSHVQNRNAMVMMNLLPRVVGQNADTYYIDVNNSVGVAIDKASIIELMREQFITKGQRIYFKFYFTLVGNQVLKASSGSCNGEFITGYAKVEDVGNDANGVFVKFAKADNTPASICKDFVTTEMSGKLNPNGTCNPGMQGGVDKNPDLNALFVNFQNEATNGILDYAIVTGEVLSVQDSYFKIPVPVKKGGGIRVKRLMVYDNGVATGLPSLYGNEYLYQYYDQDLKQSVSSGVAINEPSIIREENALVGFMSRFESSDEYANKIVAGKYIIETEGPLGENILPAPSIGHSQVIVKNIAEGKTSAGFSVSEFFTARDYAFDQHYDFLTDGNGTGADFNDITQRENFEDVYALVYGKKVNNVWLSQGFRFIENEMHGKLKSSTTYAGNLFKVEDIDKGVITTRHSVEYFKPGEQIPVYAGLDKNPILTDLGKAEEVTMEIKGIEDVFDNMYVDAEVSVGIVIAGPVPVPVPMGSGVAYYSHSESKLRTHVTSKIIHYPCFVKSITTLKDGLTNIVENAAFDAETGNAIITNTYDGYNDLTVVNSLHKGQYTHYAIPSTNQYPALKQKAENQRKIITSTNDVEIDLSTNANNYQLTFRVQNGASWCAQMQDLHEGDLIAIRKNNSDAKATPDGIYHVGKKTFSGVRLIPTSHFKVISSLNKVDVEILESGLKNELTMNAANITTYGSKTLAANQGQTASYNTKMASRKKLVSDLNALLKNPMGGTLSVANYPGLTKSDCSDFKGTDGLAANNCIQLTGLNPSQQQPGLYMFKLNVLYNDTGGNCNGIACSGTELINQSSNVADAHFDVDAKGQLQFFSAGNGCYAQTIDCIKFCEILNPASSVLNGVVLANATDFSDDWSNTVFPFNNISTLNDYELGKKGEWRGEHAYAFKTSLTDANNGGKIYSDGIFTAFTPFNYQDKSLNDSTKWIKVNTRLKYSANNEAIEESNALNVHHTTKYGYNLTLPILSAENASFDQVQFESFEKHYTIFGGNNFLEDKLPVSLAQVQAITKQTSHAGASSLQLSPGLPKLTLNTVKPYSVNDPQYSLSVFNLWVKEDPLSNISVANGQAHPSLQIMFDAASGYQPLQLLKIAQTGDWSLYRAEMKYQANAGITYTPSIVYAGNKCWIDDVRVQPLNSKMNSFVYDINTLRLVTIFDDQNFGVYYQYNGEGKQTRKLLESERGIKTVTEEYYHSPLQSRQ